MNRVDLSDGSWISYAVKYGEVVIMVKPSDRKTNSWVCLSFEQWEELKRHVDGLIQPQLIKTAQNAEIPPKSDNVTPKS